MQTKRVACPFDVLSDYLKGGVMASIENPNEDGDGLVQVEGRIERLVESWTQARIQALQFDLDVLNDKLRYSIWLTALGTGGIAVIIARFQALLPENALLIDPRFLPICAGISLFISIIVGGCMHWSAVGSFSRKRQTMTLLLKQESQLYSQEEGVIDVPLYLSQAVRGGWFLDENDRKNIEDIQKEEDAMWTNEYVFSQIAFVFIGYFIAFLAAAFSR